jgi:1,2-diacylglycerol 3-beta-galactosyltransferase
MDKKKILILTGDAGMGHRSAAEAIQEAFKMKHGDEFEAIIHNPFDHPDIPDMIRESQSDYDDVVKKLPDLYKFGYEISDSKIPVTLMEGGFALLLTEILKEIIAEIAPEIIITTYPIFIAPLTNLLNSKKIHVPVMTVVTDLATVHRIWFNNEVSCCTVPTETVYELAIEAGLSPDQIINTGIPVSPKISVLKDKNRMELRGKLDWVQDQTTLLVVGSPRIPKLIDLLHTLDISGHNLQFALVAGGNEKLLSTFKNTSWNHPVKIYDFVENMPEMMRAADVILCKAGGLIVTEALASGLPLMLIHFLPGQETGNVEFVVDNQAGALCQKPIEALETLYNWLKNDCKLLQQTAKNAQKIGRPDAAFEIVEEAIKLIK